MAAALVDDAVTGRKPEAAVFFPGGEERLEQVRFDFVAHAGAGIGDAEHNVFGGNKVAANETRLVLVGKIDN